ncbi:MAG: efflux RND transporter periplasmic adaptor subunit [Bacteroidetes bacterium]|nr:efflux RND transporter periplasmic adaptor subunit [Bacteroidota bacterium]
MKKEDTIEISDTLIKHMSVGTAHIDKVESELKLTGKVVADQSKEVNVFALVSGVVNSVNVELGDYVEKDQVLAIVNSADAADYAKQYTEAQSDYELAKKNMQVAEDMHASKLMSEQDYLEAQQNLNKAQAALLKAQDLQKIYSVQNGNLYVIKAPLSGFITEKNITKNTQIRSDNAQNVFTISQLNDVWVLANVYETDIDKVKEKDTALITTVAYPDKVYEGSIDKVYNVLDPLTRVMKVRVKLENPDYALKPEMYARVVITYTEPKTMIMIPASAIVFDNSNNYVLIYGGDKKFTVQKVELHKTIGAKAYILSGLKEGDKVVTVNQLLIYNALTNN